MFGDQDQAGEPEQDAGQGIERPKPAWVAAVVRASARAVGAKAEDREFGLALGQAFDDEV